MSDKTIIYNTADALSDLRLIEMGGHPISTRLAHDRLKGYLVGLKTPVSELVPTDRPCMDCLFHYDVAGTDECLSADAPDIDAAKRCGVSCLWFQGFEPLTQGDAA